MYHYIYSFSRRPPRAASLEKVSGFRFDSGEKLVDSGEKLVDSGVIKMESGGQE